MYQRRQANDVSAVGIVFSTLLAVAFLVFCQWVLAGCTTTRVIRDSAGGSAVSTTSSYAGVYNDTEIVQRSRDQYRDCLQVRGGQIQTSWYDNQQICFGQTSLGQGFGSAYGMNSSQFWGGMNFFGQNFLQGWQMMPQPTGYPNIIQTMNGPVLIPQGANINQGTAGPQAAMNTLAVEALRQRANLNSATQWPTMSTQAAVTVATPAPTATTVTREEFNRMVADLSATRGQVLRNTTDLLRRRH